MKQNRLIQIAGLILATGALAACGGGQPGQEHLFSGDDNGQKSCEIYDSLGRHVRSEPYLGDPNWANAAGCPSLNEGENVSIVSK